MDKHFYSRFAARCARLLCACAVAACALSASALAQSVPGSPVLLSEGTGTTTRAVAFDAVTQSSEPFSVNSAFDWAAVKPGSDQRTRITLFAMNLPFLSGEGVNALTADAQDAAGRIYPLKVEFVGKPKYLQLTPAPGNPNLQIPTEIPQEWLYSIVVRLNDEMTNTLGDVVVRVNLHGLASNGVRLAIGQAGGGPPVDPLTEFISAAPPTPPPATPTPTPKTFGPNESNDADVVRLLEQASWGPTSTEVARVKSIGLRAYLNEQFNAPVNNPAKGSNYPDLTFPPDDQATGCPSGSPQECNRDNYSLYPVQKTFYTNTLYGQDQLRQRVAFALHQITVVSGLSPLNRASWMTMYLQALDRGAFGNYRTLLQEITLNPEMGEYLDMRQSTRTSPNENFAREILQLFSLGVNELNIDGTPKLDAQGVPIPSYTQAHVNEFTRVFTGWNLVPGAIVPGVSNWRDPMVPRGGTSHDFGAKTLLNGVTTTACSSASGTANIQCAQADMTVALDNIFNHPNVGPFVGRQFIQHLVTSNPSPAYVSRVARVFNNDCDALYADGCTNVRGNMRAVVQAVLLDPEARGDVKTDPNYGKLREPAQYINNVLRAFNVKSFDKTSTSDGVLAGRSTTDFTGTLDQPIFQPTTVFSYYQPDYEVPGTKILGPAFGILSTSTTLRRANNINTLVYTGVAPTTTTTDRPRGTSLDLASLEALAANPGDIADRLNSLMLHGTMSAPMRASVINAMNAIPTSDALFARKRAQVAVYLVATSSQYDVQR
ncbi:MAG: DUF1800 domain-containing protein [Acidobacteria bacterium]|nr:DUF1800 domain-containing protein [Acidobacteriota bacterium]